METGGFQMAAFVGGKYHFKAVDPSDWEQLTLQNRRDKILKLFDEMYDLV